MKKTLCLLLCIGMLLTLASCGWFGNTEPSTDTTTPSTQRPTDSTVPPTSSPTEPSAPSNDVPKLPMLSVSLPLIHELTTSSDQQEIFRYTFQDVALNLSDPAVAKAVTLDLLQRMDSNAQSVANLEAQALKDYTPGSQWIPYYYETIYTPTRIDQTILSLSGLHTSYDGKAHPSYSASSATYDLLTGKYLSVSDILSGSADAVKTLSDALIEALDKVASEHSLFTGYQDIIRDTFSVDLNRHYAWYFTSEGICFYFSPYEIAPNSAGIIEVTVPYSKLTGVLKDAYFPVEQPKVPSSLSAGWFSQTALTGFTRFSELISHPDARRSLLWTDSAIYDIRLEQGRWDANTNQFLSEGCVFAASCMMDTDALTLRCELSDSTPTLRLTYVSDGKVQSCYITQNHETGAIVLTPIQK